MPGGPHEADLDPLDRGEGPGRDEVLAGGTEPDYEYPGVQGEGVDCPGTGAVADGLEVVLAPGGLSVPVAPSQVP